MSQPDILIFFSDQHHAGYSGFAGNSTVSTPNLDRIANHGVVFDTAYTACPLCVPARSAFLTGQLPSETGIYTNQGAVPGDQPTFLHSLAAAGYETVLCGRMHFVGEDQRHGFTKRLVGDITPSYWGRGGRERKDLGPYVGTFGRERCLEVIGGGDSPVLAYDRAVVQAALAYLSQDHEKPQCIVVGTYAPHFSYVAPPQLYWKYRSIAQTPEHNRQEANYRHPLLGKREARIAEEEIKDVRAAYFGMIENIDSQIGAVYDAWSDSLRHSGKQGMFVYLSDHGDQAGEHHLYGKETFYEGSARIPLVISGVGIEQLQTGKRVQGPVSITDIGPTLCGLAQAPALPDQSGRSLLPVLTGGEDDLERAVISEFMERDEDGRPIPGRMIRKGKWKLISYAHYEEDDLLFHLDEDPYERVNRVQTENEIYRELRSLLTQDWEPGRLIERHTRKAAHYKLLEQWGKAVQPPEPERWLIPEQALRLPARGSKTSVTQEAN